VPDLRAQKARQDEGCVKIGASLLADARRYIGGEEWPCEGQRQKYKLFGVAVADFSPEAQSVHGPAEKRFSARLIIHNLTSRPDLSRSSAY